MTYFFGFTYLEESLKDLRILQFRISQNSTSTLDGFDDFIGHVACQCETRCVGVDFHCSSQGLLCACRHAIRKFSG